ncbi:hypothetical protein [Desertibacillus haloalkaliphilus]|nr:hypothetical protein [Desertibacillus haloalkaliphilus]
MAEKVVDVTKKYSHELLGIKVSLIILKCYQKGQLKCCLFFLK